ncbi:hypothetical protein PR048_001836 [Dryococelus australis]|uniref:RNA-directed DNA polymerase n=1 Tax=Dryococelus australis TaxID=614101 RepID=A0ABQ9IIG1_9NEOP|nr:hypothetical protein PR048_001836 [Dryococelus australis]
MVTYYSRFIHGASTIATPLRRLLCKNTIFKWTSACEAAFQKLKQVIASDQLPVPYDSDLQVQFACDASPTGIARVLSHIVYGHEHPLALASCLLTTAEQNYSQLDRETLAIVFTVDNFSQYLFCRHFKFVTDNQPLTRILNHQAALPKITVGHIQPYAAFLIGFNYTIDFKKGIEKKLKQLCDATIEQISILAVTYQLLKEETKKDATLSTVMKYLLDKNTSEPDYIIESGILFLGQRDVPASVQSDVLNELHRTRVGITNIKQLARRYVYRKKIDSDIEIHVRSCSRCVAIKNTKAPSHPWGESEHNFQRIHIDYVSPYQDHHFLIMVDAKSKLAEIIYFQGMGFQKLWYRTMQRSPLVRNLHNSVKKQVSFNNSVQHDTQQLTVLLNAMSKS